MRGPARDRVGSTLLGWEWPYRLSSIMLHMLRSVRHPGLSANKSGRVARIGMFWRTTAAMRPNEAVGDKSNRCWWSVVFEVVRC